MVDREKALDIAIDILSERAGLCAQSFLGEKDYEYCLISEGYNSCHECWKDKLIKEAENAN